MFGKFTRVILLLATSILIAFASCNKFEGNQTVPSYIRIDSIRLTTDYFTFGANTKNITDAWIYIDDNPIGCFELPAVVPILEKGEHKLAIYAGIKINGIAASRAPYPFFEPKTWDAFTLYPDSIITINPVVNYYGLNTVHIAMMEDFESPTLALEATSDSDTSIYRVAGEGTWQTQYSSYSGRVMLPADTAMCFKIASGEFTELPINGAACMLEMDYNTSDTIEVGVYYCEDNTVTQTSLLQIPPTDNVNGIPAVWKKIYVNLEPVIVEYMSADYFKIYISSWYSRQNKDSYYYFDNLKLLYRDR